MNPVVLAVQLAAATAVLGACAATGTGADDAVSDFPAATAELRPTSGNTARGTVTFTQRGDMVVAHAELSGLAPDADHGFHIHEKGDCSAGDASSAGSHFDPSASPHGGPEGEVRHGGDLGNLTADENGRARGSVQVDGISIDGGPDRILGRAVVVHAHPDDLASQPAGNSGARIACGVINPSPGKAG